MTEEDEAWKPDIRETIHDLNKRIDGFLMWLSWNQLLHSISYSNNGQKKDMKDHQEQKQQQNLLVVTHGVWMECLFRKLKPEILEHDGKKRRVHNCDLYRLDLVCCWEKKMDQKEGENNQWNCTNVLLENVKFLE